MHPVRHRQYSSFGLCLVLLLFWIAFLFVDAKGGSNVLRALQTDDMASVGDDVQVTVAVSSVSEEEHVGDAVSEVIQESVLALGSGEQAAVIDIVEQGRYELAVLEKVFSQTQDLSVLGALVERLIQEFQFDQAYQYMKNYPSVVPVYISWSDYLLAYANASADSIDGFVLEVRRLYQQGMIDADDKGFYDALVAFWYGDLEEMQAALSRVQASRYQGFVDAIAQDMTYVRDASYAPDYYGHAIVALTVLQYRFLGFTQQVASDILTQDANYVLPYQLLAYSAFLSQERDVAERYVRELLARDDDERQRYQFFLGVISYRQGDFQEAVLYLVGVDDLYLLPYVYRYLILSYHELGDVANVLVNYEKLLGEPMTASDFYTFFVMAYLEPFRYGETFDLVSNNAALANQYVLQCRAQLVAHQQHVCDLGEVGQLLVQKQYDEVHRLLLVLARDYPQSYVFQALGDYYARADESAKAVKYYLKAMRMTGDMQERFHAKSKVIDLYRAAEGAKQ